MWKKKTESNGEHSSDNTTKAQDNFKKALDWETSRLELVEKSEKRAWLCSKILGLCLISTAAAIAVMMPLKKTEPFVIRVNQNTGEAAVLAIANEKDIPFSEMMDKYWLNQYVLSRESYDYRTLEHDYLKTRELSLPNVFDPYAAQFSTDDNSLDRLLGDSKKIVVEVHTVVPNGNGIATVRFGKKLVDTQTNAVDSSQNWTATIAYEYIPNFKADEPSRLINPFGFKVTSYRMDPDLTVGAAK